MPTCPNCGSTTTGRFCQDCGQQELVRLTMGGFLAHAFSRIFSMDRGYLRTFVGLMKSPGVVARDFVNGRRVWYTNPLTYWLIAATFQLLFLWTVDEQYRAYVESSLTYSMELQGDVGTRAMEQYSELFKTDDPISVIGRIMVRAVKAAYSYMGVVFAIALAFFLNLFLRKRKGGYNMAEQLVFSLYMIGHWALITAFLLPITMRISPTGHGIIGMLGYFIIIYVGSLDFHEEGRRGGLLSLLALLLAFLVYMLSLFVVMFGSIIYEVMQLAG
jgi:hypothetical protein